MSTTKKHPGILKMERASQMRKINDERPIPMTRKFDGITYKLVRVHLYKGQADHEANYVRDHGGLARVVPGKGRAGTQHKISGWRVYTKE